MLFKIFNKYLQDCLLKNCIIVTHKLTHNFTKNNFLGEICPSAKKEESCTFSNFRMVAEFTLTMSSNHFHEFFFFQQKLFYQTPLHSFSSPPICKIHIHLLPKLHYLSIKYHSLMILQSKVLMKSQIYISLYKAKMQAGICLCMNRVDLK